MVRVWEPQALSVISASQAVFSTLSSPWKFSQYCWKGKVLLVSRRLAQACGPRYTWSQARGAEAAVGRFSWAHVRCVGRFARNNAQIYLCHCCLLFAPFLVLHSLKQRQCPSEMARRLTLTSAQKRESSARIRHFLWSQTRNTWPSA